MESESVFRFLFAPTARASPVFNSRLIEVNISIHNPKATLFFFMVRLLFFPHKKIYIFSYFFVLGITCARDFAS